ncbi:DUF3576 domain-containing protein [Fodinicurvata sp. EGI_FJ10296]|uniref:DUF3576 domain-containing protein n=1 Tax=Fodinicurvata sp. EGI_FJ10296 TaxID=3231908 RepID=UPI0034562A31
MTRKLLAALAVIGLLPVLTACGMDMSPRGDTRTPEEIERDEGGLLFGDALTFSTDPGRSRNAGPASIGVNSDLWQATLDTVSFMPIDQADPFGGVVITDWYSGPETPNERIRVNVAILDSSLRSDAITVGTLRQVRANGGWADAPVDPQTARQLENAILERALQLRQSRG